MLFNEFTIFPPKKKKMSMLSHNKKSGLQNVIHFL